MYPCRRERQKTKEWHGKDDVSTHIVHDKGDGKPHFVRRKQEDAKSIFRGFGLQHERGKCLRIAVNLAASATCACLVPRKVEVRERVV